MEKDRISEIVYREHKIQRLQSEIEKYRSFEAETGNGVPRFDRLFTALLEEPAEKVAKPASEKEILVSESTKKEAAQAIKIGRYELKPRYFYDEIDDKGFIELDFILFVPESGSHYSPNISVSWLACRYKVDGVEKEEKIRTDINRSELERVDKLTEDEKDKPYNKDKIIGVYRRLTFIERSFADYLESKK